MFFLEIPERARNSKRFVKVRKKEQIDKTIGLMNKAVPDCLVSGYERISSTLRLPDENDRHVLAAAIIANAGVIVTFNIKDFPQDQLKPFNIEAQHPDEFLLHLLSLDPIKVLSVLKSMRQRLKNPPKKARAFLDTLRNQNIPLFVSDIEGSISLI